MVERVMVAGANCCAIFNLVNEVWSLRLRVNMVCVNAQAVIRAARPTTGAVIPLSDRSRPFE